MTYIKLFRKITEWEHYTDGNTMRLFLHLLLMAVHNKHYVQGIQLNRGQYYSSTRSLAEQLDLCKNSVTKSISVLRESGEIKTEKFGQGTIFTIVHYDDYQGETKSKAKSQQKVSEGYNDEGYDYF